MFQGQELFLKVSCVLLMQKLGLFGTLLFITSYGNDEGNWIYLNN